MIYYNKRVKTSPTPNAIYLIQSDNRTNRNDWARVKVSRCLTIIELVPTVREQ